jgi:uncharacterized membrane protein YccC
MMSAPGSVSSRNVSGGRAGERFPLRALPAWAQVRAVTADSVLLGASCLISYWLTARILSLAYSVSAADDALGGMWAVIATVFVVRDSYDKTLAAALSRTVATLVSFALCLAYLAVLPFHLWGLAVLVGLSVLVTTMIGRPGDAITAAITTTVVLVVAELSPHDAWQQPILRLGDTAIGVAVGLAAAWLARRVNRPRNPAAGAIPDTTPDQHR